MTNPDTRQLAAARFELAERQHLLNVTAERAVELAGQVGALQAVLKERDRRIAELEEQLAAKQSRARGKKAEPAA